VEKANDLCAEFGFGSVSSEKEVRLELKQRASKIRSPWRFGRYFSGLVIDIFGPARDQGVSTYEIEIELDDRRNPSADILVSL
jgi:hypothetical protein